MTTSLYKKDKKGNILIWTISSTFLAGKVLLKAIYGRYEGKMQQEQTIIAKGNQGRTIEEQGELDYNSKVSKQKDKGYKSLEDLGYMLEPHEEGDSVHTSKTLNSKKFTTLEDFLKANLPNDSTDASGNLKPMKCTALQDTKTNGILEKVKNKIVFPCHVQPKLDGVRCFILFSEKENKWIALSSSGKSYDVSARYILEEVSSHVLDKNLILDGELYIHGEPLQYISGLARKQTPIKEQLDLKFHIFDLPSKEKWLDRKLRFDTLKALIQPVSENIKFVETNLIAFSFEAVSDLMTSYINQDYEGVIIRNFNGLYSYGKRSSDIFKWKAFQDAEFELIGFELGKRGTEDLVFEFKTNEGKTFKAKPLGSREVKENYYKNFSKLKGTRATVQFLTFSEDGIPQGNPRVKAIRNYE